MHTDTVALVFISISCGAFGFVAGLLGFHAFGPVSREGAKASGEQVSGDLILLGSKSSDHSAANKNEDAKPDDEAVVRSFIKSLGLDPLKLDSCDALAICGICLCLCALIQKGANNRGGHL